MHGHASSSGLSQTLGAKIICAYQIDNDANIGMALSEVVEQGDIFGIDNDGVDLSKVEDVRHVVGFEAIVDRHKDASSRDNAEDGLEERRSIGGEHTNTLQAVLEEVVGQTAGAVGKVGVCAGEGLAIGGDVVNCLRVRLNGGSTLEEKGGREVVEVVAMLVADRRLGAGERAQMAQQIPQPRRCVRHDARSEARPCLRCSV